MFNVLYCLENAFVSCRLYLYIWLGFCGLHPPPHRGSAPILCWGLCPQTLHAHPTFELWLRYWRLAVRTLQRGRFVGDLGKTYSDVQEFKLGDREVRGCGGRKSPSVVQGQNL